MRKLTVLSVLASSGLLLAGCQMPWAGPASQVGAPAVEATPSTTGLMDIAKNIMAGQGYQCSFKRIEDGQTMQYKLKGDKVAMQISDPAATQGKTMNMIATKEASYMWDPTTKQGMKFPATNDMTGQAGSPTVSTPDFRDLKAWEEFQKTYQVSCTPGGASDSDFTPPADVTFQDFSAMMKAVPTGMPSGVPGTMPAGAPVVPPQVMMQQ